MKTKSNPNFLFRILCAAALLPLLAGVATADPGRHTANHVKGRADDLVNRTVSVDVAWLQPLRWAGDRYVSYFLAHTWDEREKIPGGAIVLAVPRSEQGKLVEKYESAPDVEGHGRAFDLDSRRLRAPLREGSDNSVFLDLTGGNADSPGAKLKEKIEEFLNRLKSSP